MTAFDSLNNIHIEAIEVIKGVQRQQKGKQLTALRREKSFAYLQEQRRLFLTSQRKNDYWREGEESGRKKELAPQSLLLRAAMNSSNFS